MSSILRDMRKATSTNQLNVTRRVDPGNVISHVAQGILRNSRGVKKDHVIYSPSEDRGMKKMDRE